jgi:thioredoxin-like negative regulator of GroEL
MTTVDSALQTALAHHHAGRLAEAERGYRRVLAQFPSHAGALHLLGVIALQQGRHADAVASIRNAIAVDARQPVFYNSLGEAYRALGEFSEARSSYERAIALDPAFSEAHSNLGLALQAVGDVAAAVRQFERAIQIRPDSAEAHFNLSRVLLLQGDFERGWREHAWRSRIRGHPSQSIAALRWNGLPLGGKRLLIYAEQGLGDTLQFIRYLSHVKCLAEETVVAVSPELIPLLTASGFENLHPLDATASACDAQCSLLDLPELMGTTFQSIPADTPYLRIPPRLIERWRGKLEPTSEFKIGIVWQGNPTYYSDRFRSIPLAAFEPLARIPGVRLVSLQVRDGVGQIDELAGRFEVTRLDDWDLEHITFMDTAAVMMNLDLVVTCDTVTAHLAGGLGVPVWVALSASPCWRWMLERSDSPWYAGMRLCRQSRLGQWSDVFAAMRDAITVSRQR